MILGSRKVPTGQLRLPLLCKPSSSNAHLPSPSPPNAGLKLNSADIHTTGEAGAQKKKKKLYFCPAEHSAVLKALAISLFVSPSGKGSQLPTALCRSVFSRGCYLCTHPSIAQQAAGSSVRWLPALGQIQLLLLTLERKMVTYAQQGGKRTSSEQKIFGVVSLSSSLRDVLVLGMGRMCGPISHALLLRIHLLGHSTVGPHVVSFHSSQRYFFQVSPGDQKGEGRDKQAPV